VSHNPLDDNTWEQCVVSDSLLSTTRPSSAWASTTSDSVDIWQHIDLSGQDLFITDTTFSTSSLDFPPVTAFQPHSFDAIPGLGNDSFESLPTDNVSLPLDPLNNSQAPAFDIFSTFTEPMHTQSLSQQSHSSSSSTTPTTSNPSTSSPKSKPGRKRASSPETEPQADKRRRNNAAAAKYRQKKLDRISELELALEQVSKERDELKLQMAKRDAEVELLNRLLAGKDLRSST